MTDSEFLARPGQSLSSHLDGVAKNVRRLVPDDRETPEGNSLVRLVETAAHLHDVGKYTSWFQQYLDRDARFPNPREQHADVGAFLTFHALAEQGFQPEEALAGLDAVRKHHGVLPNFASDHENLVVQKGSYQLLGEKLRNISDGAADTVDTRLRRASGETVTWDDIPTEEPAAYCGDLRGITKTDSFYRLVLRVWSTLTCADKLDAAGVTVKTDVSRPDPNDISFDGATTGVTGELNERRSRARRQVRRALLDGTSSGNDVFTLTLPTGFGKTFAGIDAALHLAERKGGRVVYALPYTTVIDQVHEEVVDQFSVEPESDLYTIHTHLVDTLTRFRGDDERISTGAEYLYGESWLAGLVLTTFVQLFESMAGPGNVQSIKLPALQDSVVVVDEPQALPRRWWHLVSHLVSVLVEEYDATVVMMTATQPRFVEEYDFEASVEELIPGRESYFGFLEDHERVRFVLDESVRSTVESGGSGTTISVTDAADRLVARAVDRGEKVLAVNNTVESAAAVGESVVASADRRGAETTDLGSHLHQFVEDNGEKLIQALRGDGPLEALADRFLSSVAAEGANAANDGRSQRFAVATLTAALRPCDRTLLVEAIRQVVDSKVATPLDNWALVVSATQLVEAGVDVSFERVYRDFAPMPSLVQAAGRCNRSFERDHGAVTVWRLGGDSMPPSEATYVLGSGRDRLRPTRDALRDAIQSSGSVIGEAEMVERVVEAYYGALHETDHTSDADDELVGAFDNARGAELREASLIDDDTAEYLVVTSDHELERLRSYVERRVDGENRAAREAFGALKHLLASVRTDASGAYDDTDTVLSELGYGDLELEELTVVDDRDSGRYTVSDGRGLRRER